MNIHPPDLRTPLSGADASVCPHFQPMLSDCERAMTVWSLFC